MDHLTVMFCCNSLGTEKLKLVIVAKPKRPRCFGELINGHRFDVERYMHYFNNQLAWMMQSIFNQWLTRMQTRLAATDRTIYLLLNNCSAHGVKMEHTMAGIHGLKGVNVCVTMTVTFTFQCHCPLSQSLSTVTFTVIVHRHYHCPCPLSRSLATVTVTAHCHCHYYQPLSLSTVTASIQFHFHGHCPPSLSLSLSTITISCHCPLNINCPFHRFTCCFCSPL